METLNRRLEFWSYHFSAYLDQLESPFPFQKYTFNILETEEDDKKPIILGKGGFGKVFH